MSEATIDSYFITCIVNGDFKVAQDEQFNSEWLTLDAKNVYDNVVKHFIDYGKVPSKETLTLIIPGGISIPEKAPEPIKFYIEKIKQRALAKLISSGVKGVLQSLSIDGSPSLALDKIKDLITSASKQDLERGNGVDIIGQANERIAHYDEIKSGIVQARGIQTPWNALNQVLLGLLPGEVTGFIARPGTGKTLALILLAEEAWKAGKTVLFISTEMSPHRIGRRFDSVSGKIPYDDMRKGKLDSVSEKKFKEELQAIYASRGPLYVYSPPRVKSFEDVAILTEEIKPDLLIIDGIYLLASHSDRESKQHEKVEIVIKQVKWLAEEKKIPAVISTQFNRQGGKSAQKNDAEMEDVAFSWSLPMTLDYFIALFQDGDMRNNNRMMLKFLKLREADNREYPIVINWNFKYMDFSEIGRWNGTSLIFTNLPNSQGPENIVAF